MVAANQPQQHQQQPADLPTSAEDEALKRNMDCVYFLASPLTCKKGSECEYRHSEYARINPRDCYYWLNGNCLNPKCGFRHPPLDALLGAQGGVSAASSMQPSKVAPPASARPMTHNMAKQVVPCIFFQKGICVKGDRCAFSHIPTPMAGKHQQMLETPPAADSQSIKKHFGLSERCPKVDQVPPMNVSKAFGVPIEAKPAPRTQNCPPRNGMGFERNLPQHTGLGGLPPQKATHTPAAADGGSLGRSNRLPQAYVSDGQSFQNGKDADDFLKESSPGFDVLVDNELRDSNYYHEEEQYGRHHEGTKYGNEFEGKPSDYNSMVDGDSEGFPEQRGYDSYERMHGQYGWDQRRTSAERVSVGPAHLERRAYAKADSTDDIVESDLRYRLSKQGRGNNMRSVVSHDYRSDNHAKEHSLRGSRNDLRHEISFSSRLQGRIKLPGRSTVDGGDNLRSERDVERERSRSRMSPGRQHTSSHQSRLRDRIKPRLEEDYNGEERKSWNPRIRRETDDRRSDFSGPKRLSELKDTKNVETMPQLSLGKRKSFDDHQQSGDGDSFKGPLPLTEILKRKRAASGSMISSINKESSDKNTIKPAAVSPVSKEEANAYNSVIINKDEVKSATNEKMGEAEIETDEGLIGEDVVEEQELEGDDYQGDVEYEYEHIDGEDVDYQYDEGEFGEGEEEYVEEEEEEEGLAKETGVLIS